MIYFSIPVILVTLVLIIRNVQPVWIQLVAFALGASFFLFSLFTEARVPSSGKFGKLKDLFQRRSLLLIGISFLLILNFVARRYEHVFDLSRSRIYDLRPQTIEWLSKVDQPVQILIFLKRDDKTVAYAEWLQKQLDKHTKKIHVEIRNINQEVALANRYDVKQTGDTVLLSGDQWVKISDFNEQVLTKGLERILFHRSSILCFLSGHGEPDLDDPGDEGIGKIKELLNGLGYRTETFSLLQKESVRECGLLVILSPRSTLLPLENTRLRELARSNLPFLLGLDPPVSKEIVSWLEGEGLTFSKDQVINKANLAQRVPLTDLVLQQLGGDSPITKQLNRPLFFPLTQVEQLRV